MTRIYRWIKIICIPTIGILMPLFFYTGDDSVMFFAWFIFSLFVTFLSWEIGSRVSSIISKNFPIDTFPLKHVLAMIVFFIFLSIVVILSIFLVNKFFGNVGEGYWSEMKGIHLIVLLCTLMITSIHEGIYLFYKWKNSLQELTAIRKSEVEKNENIPTGSDYSVFDRTGEQTSSDSEINKRSRADRENNRSTISHKKHFPVQIGAKIKIVSVDEVAFFYAMEKGVYLKTFSNHDYDIDYTLSQIEDLTDPEQFFRINRKFIVNINAITELIALSKSRIKVKLSPAPPVEIILGHARSSELKVWLNK